MTPLATSLAAAATRVLAALQDPEEKDFIDAESSLIAQLQAEEFVPSDWVLSVEPGCIEHDVVHVWRASPDGVDGHDCWLIIDPITGQVDRA